MPRSVLAWGACAALVSLPAWAVADGSRSAKTWHGYERGEPVMGTELRIRISLPSAAHRERARRVTDEAVAECRRLEALLSEWRPSSPLGRLNAHPVEGEPFPDEALALLQRSLLWSRRSGGAFDPSFASLWGLWRFDPGDAARIPSPEKAARQAALIDYRKIVIDADSRRVRLTQPGMKLGLGGIAKGYAVDRVAALLRRRGFANFFIKLGGELYLGGTRGDRPWIAAIQDPRDRHATLARLALADSAFTTSGDYEHFVIKDGVRYHHIIDPSTGYPARRCRSVTVVAPRAEDADALSTTLFVLGPKHGMRLVNKLDGVEAVFVDAQGELHVSPGLQGKLVLGAHKKKAGLSGAAAPRAPGRAKKEPQRR